MMLPEPLITLIFCVSAVVVFTIGFRLIKQGKPYARSGGDAYTKRKRLRMIGLMLWAVAFALAFLATVNVAGTLGPSAQGAAVVGTAQVIGKVEATPAATRIIPNLMHAPALDLQSADVAKTKSLALFASDRHPAPQSQVSMPVPSLVTSSLPVMPPDTNSTDPLIERSLATSYPKVPTPEAPAAPWYKAPDVVPTVGETTSPDAKATAKPPSNMEQLNAALAQLNAAVAKDPANVASLIQRGNVYANQKNWDMAAKDYRHALELKPNFSPALFNLAALDFMQDKYETARPSFEALNHDIDFGDVSKYEVFLCDLFGGREDVAAKELDVFNQEGEGANYYFANIAWSLVHKKDDEARGFMQSAAGIFSPNKINLYVKPLTDHGYEDVLFPPH